MGPVFAIAGAIGGGATAALVMVRQRLGNRALAVAALSLAVLVAFVFALFDDDFTQFGSTLGGLLPIVAVLAGLIAVRRPIDSPSRFIRVTVEGMVALVFMMLGGGVFITAIAILIVVTALRRAKRPVVREQQLGRVDSNHQPPG
jgi:hypothetical protein